MRSQYPIDLFQASYFVIDSFSQLFKATAPDFTPIYAALDELPDIAAGAVTDGDHVLHFGTGRYHRNRDRATA